MPGIAAVRAGRPFARLSEGTYRPVVLSHSGMDHISDAGEILEAQGARTILHPGDDRDGQTLDALRARLTRIGST